MSEPLTAEEFEELRERMAEPKWPFAYSSTVLGAFAERLLATLDAARDRPGLDVERRPLAYLVAAYLETHDDDCHLCRIARLELAAAQQREGAGE